MVSCLQTYPPISNTDGVPTTAPALSIIVITSVTLKLIEDRARRHADYQQNNSPTQKLENGALRRCTWTDVKVGDVVLVENHESVPADLLLISTFEADPEVPRGTCHVETKVRRGAPPFVLKSGVSSTFCLKRKWRLLHLLS